MYEEVGNSTSYRVLGGMHAFTNRSGNDEVAQHYFEVLRTLIFKKKSIFAQQVGLKEVANYLKGPLQRPKSKLMIYSSHFCDAIFSPPEAKTIIL